MSKARIRRASSQEDLDDIVYRLMPLSFHDEKDLDDAKRIREYHRLGLAVSYLIYAEGEAVGFAINRIHPQLKHVAYCPYLGINPEHRSNGFGKQVFKEMQKDLEVLYMLLDVEDPERIANGLSGEVREREVERCLRLFAFWKDCGCYIVSDPQVPYLRFSSSNPAETQAYHCLTISPTDITDAFWRHVFSPDVYAVYMQAFRHFYLEIFMLDETDPRGLPDEAFLSEKYPAIREFLGCWERQARLGQKLALLHV